jgi:hypothetical protein
MNIETLLLRGLFGACALLCGLTLAAMLVATPVASRAATGHAMAAATVHVSAEAARAAG